MSKTAMKISDAGIEFIKSWEGLELRAYQDIAGVWTIGYGHTQGFRDGNFGPDSAITLEAAEELLRIDVASRECRVEALVRVPLNQNEFDALVSFDFNTGALGRSTALRRLNIGDRDGAARAMTWWCKARTNGVLRVSRGLKNRRADEAARFLMPVDDRHSQQGAA